MGVMKHAGEHQSAGGRAPQPPARDMPTDLAGALVWEADAWAIHVRLLGAGAATMLGLEPGSPATNEEGLLEKHVAAGDWCLVLQTLYAAATRDGVHTCQHRVVRRDGSAFWAQTTVHRRPFSHGSPMLLGITIDVSAIMEKTQALLTREEQSRLLIQNLREYGVFTVTLDGRVGSWNPGAERLKGYAELEIVGAPLAQFFPGDEVARGTPERLLQIAAREGEAEYDGWLVRKDGSRFWASLTMSAVKDDAGVLRAYSNVSRDLTARREAEETLRRSEEQLRLLVDSVDDYGVFTVSIDGLVEGWNPGAQRLKGYRAHEVVGTPLSRFFPADEAAKGTPERLLREAELKGKATYEGRLVRKDGSQFQAVVTLAAIEDDEGRLRGFSQVARDVTERSRIEASLREGEERHRLLIDSLQEYSVFMLSPTGEVASWSPGAERMKGYTAEAILGAPFARFFLPDEQEKGTPCQLIERAAADGRAEYEGWVVRRNGTTFWANVLLSAVKDADGKLRGISNVARDLTARMRFERAQSFLADVGTVLAGSLDFNATCAAVARLATQGLCDACIVVVAAGDDVESVAVAHVQNDKERRLRASAGRVTEDGPADGVGAVLHTGESKLVLEREAATRLARSLGISDEDLLRDFGRCSCMALPLKAHARTFGVLVLVSAPGYRYAADDLRVPEELARRAALALDNVRLFEEAQAAVRMRDEILAVVSHDLRNPLGTIQMSARLLGQSEDHDPATSKMVARIDRACARMTHMVRDLLDFSSLEGGRLRLEPEPQDPLALVAEAVDALQPLAADEGRKVHVDRRSDVSEWTVRCDRERILQVLSNLVGNAVKFAGDGGTVRVAVRVDADRVVFSIADTGPGIASEDLAHIFDRYWRGKEGSRNSYGLGLAISKAIVELHGGAIWVESAVGAGATFSFALPAVRRAPAGTNGGGSAASSPESG
jgi:PAS domain S-box-containing protein